MMKAERVYVSRIQGYNLWKNYPIFVVYKESTVHMNDRK